MLNLFRGEVYRVLHKRNMYLFLGAVVFGYLAITFMRVGGFGADSVVTDAATMMQLMPALLGGYFFAALFTDDLAAKNLITLVGYGMSRTRIVLTKLALMVLFTVVSFALITAIHLAAYAVFGFAASGEQIRVVLAIALQFVLLTFGFAVISAIVVYGTQKPTFAVVTFFMLAFNVVTMLVNAAANLLNFNLGSHLISGTTGQMMLGLAFPGGNILAPGLEYLAYLILATIAAIVIFKKREMEF